MGATHEFPLRQVVILVGGAGTRLGELTVSTPKPLLSVGGRPFLDHLLDEITRYRTFQDIVLLAGRFGQTVAERYGGRSWRDANVRVVVEGEPMGTAGALKHAAQALQERFMLMNGDSLFDINLLDLAAAPLAPGIAGRLALKRDHAERRYGRVEIRDHLVSAFRSPQEAATGPISAGIYVVDRKALDLIKTTPSSLEGDVFPQLAGQGALEARVYDRFFIDIGVPADLARADRELSAVLTRPAIFLDRDGVLNRDVGYAHRREQIEWIDGALAAVKACNDAGALVFVVSNQAGVARGYYDEASVKALHAWMNAQLAAAGAHVDAFEYCPHHEQGTVDRYRRACARRKPAPGMMLDLMRSWPVDRSRSLLIGDKESDLAAGAAAGIESVRFPGGNLRDFLLPLLERHGISP